MLKTDKENFKQIIVTKDKEHHFTFINRRIHQEYLVIINIYTRDVNTLNFIKQTLLDINIQIDPSTITVCDSNTPLSIIKRSPSPKK
jgi:hypothetical protein